MQLCHEMLKKNHNSCIRLPIVGRSVFLVLKKSRRQVGYSTLHSRVL